jgi:hypothetical protein
VLCYPVVNAASKAEEVDRIISNILTNYKKEVHPSSNRYDGAVEVGISVIPLFLDIVSTDKSSIIVK